jgi:LacI family transcriptional regulator
VRRAKPAVPGPRAVTLKQFAAHARVHASTESRALNPATRRLVADDLAKKIQATAATLGFRPNAAAASLRTGRSHLVGVLLPDISNPVFSPILSGITEALSFGGYSTIVADVGEDVDRQLRLIDDLRARRVDGFILATVHRDDRVVSYCLERNIRVVLVNRSERRPRVSAAVSDDEFGIELAMDHLVKLGHRAIGHLAAPARLSTGYRRLQSFKTVVARLEQNGKLCHLLEADAVSREAGAVAARAMLAERPDLTAIIAANDLLALGTYDALRELKLKCPEDVSVVGHNDMPLADLVSPPLTTVHIGCREMGGEAAQLLIAEIAEPGALKRNVVVRPTLTVRSSTAPPRGR